MTEIKEKQIKVNLVAIWGGVDGEISLYDAFRRRITNIQFVKIFFQNSEGRLWIPRRPETDLYYPDCLDVSVAKPVESGLTFDDAFLTFQQELWGERLPPGSICYQGYAVPKYAYTDCYAKVYSILIEEIPEKYAAGFPSAAWLAPQEVLDEINKGTPASIDLRILLIKHYSKHLSVRTITELLDFDPEKALDEFIDDFLEGYMSPKNKNIFEARRWAEKEVDKKLGAAKQMFKNILPADSDLLPKASDEGSSRHSDEDVIAQRGYLPMYYWKKEEMQDRLQELADRHGVPFRRYCFSMTFSCSYGVGSSYKASGELFKEITLADGTVYKSLDKIDDQAAISLVKRRDREKYRDEEATVLYIHDPAVLPARVRWISQDMYSASGIGTSGRSSDFVTEIFQAPDGKIATRLLERD